MCDHTIIDLDDALNRALGDAAFLKMMYEEFEQMVPDLVGTIQKSIENNDMETLDRTAHQLKGAAANLGVVGISAASQALEHIGKSGESSDAQEAFHYLESNVVVFHEQLSQIDWATLGD